MTIERELVDAVSDSILKDERIEKMEWHFQEIIKLLGEDVDREGLLETPQRIAKAWLELTGGLHTDPRLHLKKTFTADADEMVIVGNIPFSSICEHHFVPFTGTCHIGYIPGPAEGSDPNEGPYKIVGLSKFARLVNGYASRPQVQEQLTNQIATAIDDILSPQGVIVVMKAGHMCMSLRGVKSTGSVTTTSAVRGLFATNVDGVKQEFFSLLALEN